MRSMRNIFTQTQRKLKLKFLAANPSTASPSMTNKTTTNGSILLKEMKYGLITIPKALSLSPIWLRIKAVAMPSRRQ